MADIRRVKLPNGTTYNIKDNTARSSITNITNGTTKLPYGKSLSITNDTELNLLDPNNKVLSTVNLSKSFKHAHFVYMNGIRLVIDEVSNLTVGDLVYITQLPASDVVNANSLFYVSDIYNGNAFYMNSGENKADFLNTYVYSISTRYDYIVKVINVRSRLYDFEIIAGGPIDDLIKVNESVYSNRTNLINTLGIVLEFSSNDNIDQYTQLYLEMYDSSNNQIIPTAEYYGVLANGKVILQYTCNKKVVKIKTKDYKSHLPNYICDLSYVNDILQFGESYILYSNNNNIAEGTFVSGDLTTAYVGASSWDYVFICDYAYTKII